MTGTRTPRRTKTTTTIEPRVLHTGEGRVLVPLSVDEIRDMLNRLPSSPAYSRLVTALALLDPDGAKEFTS